MRDLVFVGATALFFAIGAAYIAACRALGQGGRR